MSKVHLLGVPIDAVTRTQALELIHGFLREGMQRHVMTPNNEMLVEAFRNPPFRVILNATALNIPDSIGLIKAARWTGQVLPERVTGVDTVTSLCAELTEETPVFLLGAAPGVAERAAEKLMQGNPRLRIVGCAAGSPREDDAPAILQAIRAAAPHLLLVAYGAPAQDMWIAKYLKELPSVRVAIGVGGTFDFIAGTRRRAPSWMQRAGLEWFWRLIREPKRIGRIWRAVVVFPWLVLCYCAHPMPKSLLILIGFLLTLSACTLSVRPVNNQTADSSSSSQISSASTAGGGEEIGEGAPATEEATETGALAERLLATGIVEIGNASAPLTLLIFTEHNCSYCRQFMTELFPRLKTDFLDKGTLKVGIAMLPLQKYPASREAAMGLICSAAQGQGLAIHRILFTNPNKSTDAILSYATELKLDTKMLRDCLGSPRALTLLDAQEAWAKSLGVGVVPSFFLNGEKFIGLPYYPDLKGRIEDALKKAREQE